MSNKFISRVLFICLCVNTLPQSLLLCSQQSRMHKADLNIESEITNIKNMSAGLTKVKRAAPVVLAGAGIVITIIAIVLAVIVFFVLKKGLKKL